MVCFIKIRCKHRLIYFQFVNVLLSAILMTYFLFFKSSVSATTPERELITIIPDKLKLSGDIATKSNTADSCTEHWLSTMPEGSIILGVNPASCNPADWHGGSATTEIFLPDTYSPTVWVLKLSWPDQDGKGLHSPKSNSAGIIMFDRQILWSKSTLHQSIFNDYYAAEHEAIITTIVVTKPDTHILSFSVPEQTAWDLSKIEFTAYPYPQKMKGIGYSPYRDCQMPGSDLQPAKQEIEEDLFRLFHTCNTIRTYGAIGVNGEIPAIADSIGLRVLAGAWIDGDKKKDDEEVKALIEIAHKTNLDGLIVGSEYYLRHQTKDDVDYLLQRIVQVKEAISGAKVPITTSEISGLMFNWNGFVPEINPLYRPILDRIDFILVHIYPFWDKLPIEGAADVTAKQYKAIQTLIEKEYPDQNKRVIIGETGWPSAGRPNGASVPSLENQKRYLREFLQLAEHQDVEYLYFTAFDELWKIEEQGSVGQNWGYSYSDRTAKHDFYGVLIPPDQLSTGGFTKPEIPLEEPEITSNGRTYPVYTEWPTVAEIVNEPQNGADSIKETHFVPSGFMGDTVSIELFECDRSNPHSGEMATRITCSLTGANGWCGIYWLPSGLWEGPGINIYEKLGVNHGTPIDLTFWARGERGGEIVKFKVGGVGRQESIQFPVETNWIGLQTYWTEYRINLSDQDFSNVVGGFCWVTNKEQNLGRDEIRLFLDDIKYEIADSQDNLAKRETLPVYEESENMHKYLWLPSGWMPNGQGISFQENSKENPHNGNTCIKVGYKTDDNTWVGIYWLANDSWDGPGIDIL